MAQLEQEPVMCSKMQATFDMGSKTHTILWMRQGLVGPLQSLSAIYPPCTTCAHKDRGWWQRAAENPLLTICPFFANNPSTHRACQVAFHTDIWRRCQAIKHDSVFYFCYFFVDQFDSPNNWTTLHHMIRPLHASSLPSPVPRMPTFGWLLSVIIKRQPPKARDRSISLFFDVEANGHRNQPWRALTQLLYIWPQLTTQSLETKNFA